MIYKLLNGWTYNSDTGELISKKKSGLPFPRKNRPDGYIQIYYAGKLIYAHRLIWLSIHGKIPKGMEVDHIDGDRGNCRLDNLQLLNKSENTEKRKPSSNRNWLPGVTRRSNGNYRARIVKNKHRISLGDFATEEEAFEAYLKAKRLMHVAGAAEMVEKYA